MIKLSIIIIITIIIITTSSSSSSSKESIATSFLSFYCANILSLQHLVQVQVKSVSGVKTSESCSCLYTILINWPIKYFLQTYVKRSDDFIQQELSDKLRKG